MNDLDDPVKQLLLAADPARNPPPPRTPLPQLLETIMATAVQPTIPPRPPTRAWWLVAAAVIAVLAAAAGTLFAVTRGNGGIADVTAATTPPAKRTVLNLALPGSTSLPSCMPFSIDALADMPVAFSGTVTTVTDTVVTLDVDHWYRGGSADQVRLVAPDGDTISLSGAVKFVRAHRYLITATNGTVNYCGYSGGWSAGMEQRFRQAFER